MKTKILIFTALFISLFSYSQKSSRNGENNELIYKEISDKDLTAFDQVHTPPLSPNCKAKWKFEKKKRCFVKYISGYVNRNLNTDLALKEGIKSIVQIEISFIIDKEGNFININATGSSEIINEDAINVINALPKLEPAQINGEPVNLKFRMPVAYMVN